jgi:hypothetical protein
VKQFDDAFSFVMVDLDEPGNDALQAWPEESLPRLVNIIGLDRPSSMVYEAVVSLTDQAVVEWRDVPGARASMTCQRTAAASSRCPVAHADLLPRRSTCGSHRRRTSHPCETIAALLPPHETTE